MATTADTAAADSADDSDDCDATTTPGAGGPVFWSTPVERRQARRASRPVNARPRGPRGSLTPEQIGVAAIDLIRAEGAARLSLRRLADRMGVGTATLYWYVRDKDELMDLVRDQLAVEILARASTRGDWRTRLESLAMAFRQVQAAHPGHTVWTGTPGVGPNILKVIDHLLAAMVDAGLDPARAATACGAFLGLVTSTNGWVAPPAPGSVDVARAAGRATDYLAALPLDTLVHVRSHAAALLTTSPDANFQTLLTGLLDTIAAWTGSSPPGRPV